MRVYLACFDIEDDRKRRRLSRLLLEYGDRVQYSVFEITVKNEQQLEQLRNKCQQYADPTDSLRFYWLDATSRAKSYDVWGEPIARFPQGVVL